MQLDNLLHIINLGKLKHVCVYSKKSIILIEELPYFFWYQVLGLVIPDKNWINTQLKFFVWSKEHMEAKKLNKQDNKPPPLKKNPPNPILNLLRHKLKHN